MKKRLYIINTKYKKLISLENLTLAWDRINSATNNISYKNFYRQQLLYYEYDLKENLKTLSNKLKKHSFEPSKSVKLYRPKQSGLQRPFSFLEIEDMIVYQAITNIIIPTFYEKRKKFEEKFVFSNIFNKNVESNVFLYKNWKECYKLYKKNISKNFSSGYIYTAHFDLASYYDTIDHNSLLAEIFMDTQPDRNEISKLLIDCLKEWCNKTEAARRKISHGIPQGPLASSVLGELYLYPVDKYLTDNNIVYSRYVDDIVIQGKTIEEVQRALILLDIKCKEKGLIPQTSKVSVFEAKSLEEAIGKNPSLTTENKQELFANQEKLLETFKKSFEEGDSFDSSMIRYILKCYRASNILLKKVIKEFKNHYEFAEEFCMYLRSCIKTDASLIHMFLSSMLKSFIPYESVEYELWSLLAELNKYFYSNRFAELAINRLKETSSPIIHFGVYTYLATLKDNRFIGFITHENTSFVYFLILKYINSNIVNNDRFSEVLNSIKNRKNTVLISLITKHLYFMQLYDEITNEKYEECIKLLPKPNPKKFETVNFILNKDYGISKEFDWEKFFGDSYEHANELFYTAYNVGKRFSSSWLNSIDSFNELVTRSLIYNLAKWKPNLKCPELFGLKKDGSKKINEYGHLLTNNSPFATEYSSLVIELKKIHNRRKFSPLSHAYDINSLAETQYLTKQEFKEYFRIEKSIIELVIEKSNKYMKDQPIVAGGG